MASIFFDSWVVPYCIPVYVLADTGIKFTSKLFATVFILLGLKYLTATAYHPQTSAQVEQYNHTIVTRLTHYVAEI